MARLFLTPKMMDFMNDRVKELTKDIVGHKVYWFSIDALRTDVHEVYGEAPEKIYNDPVELNCLVQFFPEDVRTNQFGSEEVSTLEVYIHKKDLIDREIDLQEGDFFSFGTQFFEATSVKISNLVYMQVENDMGIRVVGKQARRGQFESKVFGPTGIEYSDEGAIQEVFVQQRGNKGNLEGETGDKRELRNNNILEPPIEGQREVSPRGSTGKESSSFYDE